MEQSTRTEPAESRILQVSSLTVSTLRLLAMLEARLSLLCLGFFNGKQPL